MDVPLHGINQVKKTLSGGKVVTYYYAWKGGPRLSGEFGSPEFIASYVEAHKSGPILPGKTLSYLIDRYTSSKYFDSLKDSTKIGHQKLFRRLRRELGEMPLAVFSDPRTIDVLEDWRDAIAAQTVSQAAKLWIQLSRMLKWGLKRQLVKANPCASGGTIYDGSRAEMIWSAEQTAVIEAGAPENVVDVFVAALWGGQRLGSLLKLRWSAYDGDWLEVEQEKNRKGRTPRVVAVPVKGPFKERLDQMERRADVVGLSQEERQKKYIFLTAYGKPWASAKSFGTVFGTIAKKLGIEDRTFHDLRGTAVTRLIIAGCIAEEIATITGHSLPTVQAILDKYYFCRDRAIAEKAQDKRVAYEAAQLTSQPAK